VTAPEHTIERTPELIQECESGGFYTLNLMLRGESLAMQDSRESVLREGDLTIFDTTRPYSLLSSEAARTAVIVFPREMIALSPELVSQLTAVRFDRSQGLAAGVSAFISHLMMHLEQFSRPSGSRLLHNIVDLLGTMFVSELDLAPEDSSRGGDLVRQIMGHIEEHLSDPCLTPGSIAAAHYISARYLQVLFQRSGATVSSWVRERRLERCYRDLGDPALASEPVSVLAAKWGFFEASHFSRSFKRRFGISPRERRMLSMGEFRGPYLECIAPLVNKYVA
jgi:AraC-like DNA-binding protein